MADIHALHIEGLGHDGGVHLLHCGDEHTLGGVLEGDLVEEGIGLRALKGHYHLVFKDAGPEGVAGGHKDPEGHKYDGNQPFHNVIFAFLSPFDEACTVTGPFPVRRMMTDAFPANAGSSGL